MDRPHDLGGRPGFGPVVVEADEAVFHHAWERTARALVYAASMGHPNPTTSGFRDAIERMTPEHYLSSSYYEHWLTAAATLAVEGGQVTSDQLDAAAGGRFPLSGPAVPASAVAGLRSTGGRFEVGQPVRVRAFEPAGHTRCPTYVRGRSGVVVSVQCEAALPDVEAHGPRRDRERVYTVRFTAAELWGEGAEPAAVHVGLWDSYLDAA